LENKNIVAAKIMIAANANSVCSRFILIS
jgi:hypothetical protein